MKKTELQCYVGVYGARDTTADPSLLEIGLVNNELLINHYWPNGCRLMAEGEGRFRLQSTNRRVTFDPQALVAPSWLVYTYGGREYWYDRVNAP